MTDEQRDPEERQPDGGRTPDERSRTAGPAPSDAPLPDELGRAVVADTRRPPGDVDESSPASDDKALHRGLSQINQDELDHLPIVRPGTELEQAGIYIDLDNPGHGPFRALGGQTAGTGNRYVAKRDVDHELWNRLVQQDSAVQLAPEIVRPEREEHSLANQYEQDL